MLLKIIHSRKFFKILVKLVMNFIIACLLKYYKDKMLL